MRSEPEMRKPYGPGWEDPDWAAHATPPDESAEMKVAPSRDHRPLVNTLSQFMQVVKRFATPRRRAVTIGATPVGQTRRWVMAGGAGFVALATLPSHARPPEARKGEAPIAAVAEEAADESSSPDRRLPGKR